MRGTGMNIRALIYTLNRKPQPEKIEKILGYKTLPSRGKNTVRFVKVPLDRFIEHRPCQPWLFIRELERKLEKKELKCCNDPLHRRIGFLYKKIYFWSPFTLLKELEGKRQFRASSPA